MRNLSKLLVYPPLLASLDLLFLFAGFALALIVQGGMAAIDTPYFSAYLRAAPSICAVSLLVLHLSNLYTGWLERPGRTSVSSAAASVIAISLATMAGAIWEHNQLPPGPVMALAALFQFAFLAGHRLVLQRFYRSTVPPIRVLVVATDEDRALAMLRKLAPDAPDWICFAGGLGVGDTDTLEAESRQWDAVLATPDLAGNRRLIDRCARLGKDMLVIPGAAEMLALRARPVEIGDALLFFLPAPGLSPGQCLFKRILDVAASIFISFVMSPVLLIAYVMVRCTSKGPAIFAQDRVGKGGKEFTLYKFRTMVADAERHTGPVLAQETDSRITTVGGLLRATRIDELPQLFNVFLGDMSLIGPRPEREFFVRTFLKSVPGYQTRFTVKPGITGLAQVAAGYATPVERKLSFDLLYIYDYSIWLDLRILLRTFSVVLHKEKAVGLKTVSETAIADEP